MAKYAYLISLLLFFLALSITQGQEDHGLARVAAENLEPIGPIPSRRPQTYRYAKTPQRDERALRDPVENTFAAQLSAMRAQLIEQIYHVVDDTSRSYRYLKAAIEYERAVGYDATTRVYVVQLWQKMSKPARSAIQQPCPGSPGTRTMEIKEIAEQAGLRYGDIPNLALKLEGTVRQLERFGLTISELSFGYTMQYSWGNLLVGLWREKLTLGFAWIFRSCVFNAGTGRCWPAVGYTVRLLLVGPISALLHTVYLALKR